MYQKLAILFIALMPTNCLAQASYETQSIPQRPYSQQHKIHISQDGISGEAPIRQYIDPGDEDTDKIWGSKPVPRGVLLQGDDIKPVTPSQKNIRNSLPRLPIGSHPSKKQTP